MDSSVLRFKRLSANAKVPEKLRPLSAGYVLFSACSIIVPASGKSLVLTDLCVYLPDGCYGRISPLSDLADHKSIHVFAGVVDGDYRGNVGVVLFNFGDADFLVNVGDPVALLICQKIFYPILLEVSSDDEFSDTERGDRGFGSSGV